MFKRWDTLRVALSHTLMSLDAFFLSCSFVLICHVLSNSCFHSFFQKLFLNECNSPTLVSTGSCKYFRWSLANIGRISGLSYIGTYLNPLYSVYIQYISSDLEQELPLSFNVQAECLNKNGIVSTSHECIYILQHFT